MQIDPSKEVTLKVPAGAIMMGLSALSKMPYEQVADAIRVIEAALVEAVTPADPKAGQAGK